MYAHLSASFALLSFVDLRAAYATIVKDPRYQDLLFTYAPELSSIDGARQKGRIALHPSHIPFFGLFAKFVEAKEATNTATAVERVEKYMKEEVQDSDPALCNSPLLHDTIFLCVK